MNLNFKTTIDACVGACKPASAWSTTGEVDTLINYAVEYAVKYGNTDGRTTRVLVWRESVGFEEYGAFVSKEGGKTERVTDLSADSINFKVTAVPDAKWSADDDFPGANVPFAIDFMKDFDTQDHRVLFVLRDWHAYIANNHDHIDKQLALLEQISQAGSKHIIMIGQPKWSDENIPVELNPHMYRQTLEMPTKAERLTIIGDWANEIKLNQPEKFPLMLTVTDEDLEAVADATGGLTRIQTEEAILMSLVMHRRFDMSFILNEKQNLVKQAGFAIVRPESGFERIGGLTPLKEWAVLLRKRFTKEAFDYGFLTYPRGLLMAGVPGCGKSAIAKAIANEWSMNLLTVSAEDLKGSLVGESEAKVGTLLRTAKAAAPIILFVDEAEKLLGKSDGVNDGGAHDAVLGQFLSFMQEDTSGVFFVFTANNMEKFAPELVDRFEGRFFIDLPSALEREEILRIHLGLRNQGEEFDMAGLVKATKDFSGRNIEQAIEGAMNIAFNENRPLTQEDLLGVFSVVIPTSKTKKAEIETMRTFVENGMMRSANNRDSEASGDTGDKSSKLRNFV